MRLIKRLVVLLLLLVLLVGGGYGFYWYQVKTYIDDQIVALSPQVVVTYEKLWVDPRGEIRLDQLKLLPRGQSAQMPIRSISLRGDDPLFFIDAAGRSDRGEWPGFMALAVNGMKLDISAAQTQQVDDNNLVQTDMNALACGDVRRFTPQVLGEMGVKSTVVDLTLTAKIDNVKGNLDLGLNMDMSGIGYAESDLQLTYAAGYLKPATAMAANPRLAYMRAAYQDNGYYAKREGYCSGKVGVSVEDYRRLHKEAVNALLQNMGMRVPPVLLQAYQDATERGGSVELKMRPVGGLGAEVMMGLESPNEVIDRLGMRLIVNSNPVDISKVNWMDMMPNPERALAKAPEQQAGVKPEVAEQAPVTDPTLQPDGSALMTSKYLGINEHQKPPEKSFKSTRFEELSNYINADVRIRTYYGNRVEGRLESATADGIRVLQRVDKGLAIYPVERSKLDVIEVFRE